MKPASILLIINPVSGRMKSKTGLFEILDELYRYDATTPRAIPASAHPADTTEEAAPAYGRVTPNTLGGEVDSNRLVTVVPTMYRGHASQLAANAAKGGYDTVICCGGDGTLNETIAGLLQIPAEKRPAIGYIPAGSTNDFASSLGLPTTLRGAARIAVSSEEFSLDIGNFAPINQPDMPTRNFSYIASSGIFTASSYATPQAVKNALGRLAYFLEGVKDLANIHPNHASFTLDNGTVLEGDYVFGAVSNTTTAGGIFKLPAGEVSLSDGQLEVFLVHNPRTPAELTKAVTALMSGNFTNCPMIELHHVTSVDVHLEKPLSWSLDGEEAQGGTDIHISCIPSAVQFKKKSNN